MNLSRSGARAEIVLRAHILNPLWLPRARRREIRCNVATEAIPRYLKRYVHPGVVKDLPAVRDDANDKVFMFWGFGPTPPLVNACMRSAEKNLTQKVLLLNEKTLYDYIDLPGVIMDKRNNGQIATAHFLDICRVELLHNHGGFWLDATGFVTAPIPQNIVDQDFFVYLAGTVGSPYSFIQNCFIRGRKHAYLLEAWRAVIQEFWKNEPREFDYFMHQLMFKALVQKDPRAAEYFAEMPHIDQDPTHALWWSAARPFDQKEFDKITSGAFFQKTAYKSPWAKNPPPGSFADVMINKMYKGD
jgi:hypothetical protein